MLSTKSIERDLEQMGAHILSSEPGHVHFCYDNDEYGQRFALSAIARLETTYDGWLALAPRGGDFYYNN